MVWEQLFLKMCSLYNIETCTRRDGTEWSFIVKEKANCSEFRCRWIMVDIHHYSPPLRWIIVNYRPISLLPSFSKKKKKMFIIVFFITWLTRRYFETSNLVSVNIIHLNMFYLYCMTKFILLSIARRLWQKYLLIYLKFSTLSIIKAF